MNANDEAMQWHPEDNAARDHWIKMIEDGLVIAARARERVLNNKASRSFGGAEEVIAGNHRLIHLGYMAQVGVLRAMRKLLEDKPSEAIMISTRAVYDHAYPPTTPRKKLNINDADVLDPKRMSAFAEGSIKYILIDEFDSGKDIVTLFKRVFAMVMDEKFVSKLHPDHCFIVAQKYSSMPDAF